MPLNVWGPNSCACTPCREAYFGGERPIQAGQFGAQRRETCWLRQLLQASGNILEGLDELHLGASEVGAQVFLLQGVFGTAWLEGGIRRLQWGRLGW